MVTICKIIKILLFWFELYPEEWHILIEVKLALKITNKSKVFFIVLVSTQPITNLQIDTGIFFGFAVLGWVGITNNLQVQCQDFEGEYGLKLRFFVFGYEEHKRNIYIVNEMWLRNYLRQVFS